MVRVARTTALLALTGLAVAAGPAEAARPKLVVRAVSTHYGSRITPGEHFVIKGVVRNRGKRASRALVAATLRSYGRLAFSLGATSISRVNAGRRRSFRIRATGPVLAVGSEARRFTLKVCVRRSRGARPWCRDLARRPLVTAPAGGPGGAQTPGSGSPDTTTPGPADAPFGAGARSAGDRLFPEIGNGGYDAKHYDLALTYDPATDMLQGTATIDATALQNLSEYSFDLFDMPASSVLVDGKQATFAQPPGKLVVTPPAGIGSGASFTTTVTYATPMIKAYVDPDGSDEGWVPSSDGAFVVNEPVGAMSWFPNDNVPTDKATYDIHVTVPGSSKVVGNGRLVSNGANPDGTSTWHWREDSPMASYLVTATNGDFEVTMIDSNPERPAWYAVDTTYTPAQKTAMRNRLVGTPGILDFYAGFLGTPYPFSSTGGIVDRSGVNYSLETQSKPNYAVNNQADAASPSSGTIAHELAHQWFGDDVSPATWSDIWLNEGPAEFFSWLWLERSATMPLPTTDQRFQANYNNPAMTWNIPPANPPTAADIFDRDAMYTRGAMVMEALRQILGEDTFKAVLATYLSEHKYGNASTQQFIDLVKKGGGVDTGQLATFFQEWLYGTVKPGITPANFDTYTAP